MKINGFCGRKSVLGRGVDAPAEHLTTVLEHTMADDQDAPDPWGAPTYLAKAMHRTQDSYSRPAVKGKRRQTAPLRTRGYLKPGLPAFVYVAGADGRVKIGMTTDVAKRGKDLGAPMAHWMPVVPEAARDVEGLALTMLGRYNDAPGEWVSRTLAEAIEALRAAYEQVARYRHTDPALSADDARRARIAACAPGNAVLAVNP